MKVDGSLKTLLQGVSQQPPRTRLPGQCTDQLNMSSDPVTGLTRRPPTDLVSELTSDVVLRWYNFETQDSRKFIAAITATGVKVWDYNGVPQTVHVESGLGYLAQPGKYVAGTVENDTVIINTSTIPRMEADVAKYFNDGPGSSCAAIVQVLGAQYGRTYSLYMDGELIGQYRPPNGTSAWNADWTYPIFIARILHSCLTSGPSSSGGSGDGTYIYYSGKLKGPDWTVVRVDHLLLIKSNTGRRFTMTCTDEANNINMKVLVDTVKNTADLPNLAPHGYIARVSKNADPAKDMSLQFVVDGKRDPNRVALDFERTLVDPQSTLSATNHNAATFAVTDGTPAEPNNAASGTASLFMSRASSQSIDFRPVLPFDMSTLSVFASFRRNSVGTMQTLFSMSNTSYSSFANVALKFNTSNKLELYVSSNGTSYNVANGVDTGVTVTSLTAWNKITYQYDGTKHKVLFNDTEVYSVTGAKASPCSYLNVGQAGGTDFYDGYADALQSSSYGQTNATYALGEGFGVSGYWREAVAAGSQYKIDRATMPHVLSWDKEAGTFTYKQGSWEDRRTGNAVSNPDPSFIGRPIMDVGSFQGRLIFVAGSNVIMSRTNHRLDFWFESLSALADTDPIDVTSSAVEVSTLTSIVPYSKDLILFSKQGQFVVYGRAMVTAKNAALVLTTSFESDIAAKPTPAGRNVFFSTNYGAFTGIREFYATGNMDIHDSRPITQHVNRFINGKATNLASTSSYNTLIVQTDADKTVVYPYQYIWSDEAKVQAAWSRWKFSFPVAHVFFDDELVYLVKSYSGKHFLSRMSLDVHPSEGVGYPVFLDERFDVLGLDREFVLPSDMFNQNDLTIVQGTGCPNPGLPAPVESIRYDAVQGYICRLALSMGGGSVVGGLRYTSQYRPTMPVVKDQDNVAIGTGKLVIRSFMISLRDTGYVSGYKITKWGNGPLVEFNARRINDIDNVAGHQPLSNEKFLLPFREDTGLGEILLSTDSHLPMTLLDVEWQGQYNKRGKRISTGSQQQ